MKTLTAIVTLLITSFALAQDGVGIGTVNPDESAVLDVHSPTGDKGMLIPRITGKENVDNPANGLMLLDSADHNLYRYNGAIASWQAVFPRGGIIMWSGDPANLPAGWALCDGTNSTPNLSGRFIVSYSANTTEYGQISNTGGQPSVQLQTSQLPSHNHSLTSNGDHSHYGITTDGGLHNHSVRNGSGGSETGSILGNSNTNPNFSGQDYSASYVNGDGLLGYSGNHSHSFSTNTTGEHTHTVGNTGGAEFHENRPPYYVLAFIMKL